jgi:hypothetical protein
MGAGGYLERGSDGLHGKAFAVVLEALTLQMAPAPIVSANALATTRLTTTSARAGQRPR